MSGVLQGIGKVFGKVLKVAKKVAIPALMVGAVVLTGGAALGVLPALGTMVGGLGLSAGLTSVLTGAISTGAIGAVGGFLTGGMKGATKGFLLGAATGGVLGGLGVIGPNGMLGGGQAAAAKDIASSAAKSAGGLLQNSSLTSSILPTASSGGSLGATVAAGGKVIANNAIGAAALPSAAAVAAPAAASGVSGLLANPQLISSITGGLAQAFAPNEYNQRYTAEQEAAERNSYYAYGGGDPDGKKKKFGMIQGVYSGQSNPFGTPNYGTPPAIPTPYQAPTKRWVWDPTTNSVVETGAA